VGARFGVQRAGDLSVTLVVTGAVDYQHAPAMIGAFRSAMEGGAATATSVDLARVSFLDSMAVAALLICRRAALDAGRSFRVVNAGGVPARVLEMAGVRDMLGLSGGPDADSVPTGF